MQTLKVKKLYPDAKLPVRKTNGAAGYDVYSYRGGVIPARQKAVIPTGISIEMPNNSQSIVSNTNMHIFGLMASRSGLSAKNGLEKGAGVIDYDYTGELTVILYNHSDTDFVYEAGTRIAQLILIPVFTPEVVEVDELHMTERADNGFGSSGLY